jgi:hypothetical protein
MTRTLRLRLRLRPRHAILSALIAPAALLAVTGPEAVADSACATPSLEQVSLDANGSATTAPVVVGSAKATVCFSVRAGAEGTLRVDAVFQDAAGAEQVVPVGEVAAAVGEDAAVTLSADGLPAPEDATTPIALRFTAADGSAWDIGDLHIDPYGKG